VRKLYFDWLREHRPELVPRYKELYRRGAYAPPEERRRLERLVNGPDGKTRHRMILGAGAKAPPERRPAAAEQGRLF
jgi:hypothetical protein